MHIPARPPLFPLFLSLEGIACLVVGMGRVGRRKLAAILHCEPASILVLDVVPAENLSREARILLEDPRVAFESRRCEEKDIPGRGLVFAATGSEEENVRIAALCRLHAVPCNCASRPEAGSFQVPAVARRGGICIALSTGGASPALARRWRLELEKWLDPRSATACLMSRLRPLVLALNRPSEHNAALFEKIASSPLQDWLAEGDARQCREWLMRELPPELHPHVTELLDDLS